LEGESREHPLKVCPHCSVASRTDSETCPNCGISQLIDGNEDGITVEEASSIEVGSDSRAELTERLGEPESETTIGRDRVCLDYVVTGGPDPGWLFCFRGDQLESSAPLPE
jgi:RNA polymerase subunit RPABC4/transcription elongation factor Spt4